MNRMVRGRMWLLQAGRKIRRFGTLGKPRSIPARRLDVVPAEHSYRDYADDQSEPEQDADGWQRRGWPLAPRHDVLHARDQIAQRHDVGSLLDPARRLWPAPPGRARRRGWR